MLSMFVSSVTGSRAKKVRGHYRTEAVRGKEDLGESSAARRLMIDTHSLAYAAGFERDSLTRPRSTPCSHPLRARNRPPIGS